MAIYITFNFCTNTLLQWNLWNTEDVFNTDTNFIKFFLEIKKIYTIIIAIKGLKVDDLKFGLFLLFCLLFVLLV